MGNKKYDYIVTDSEELFAVHAKASALTMEYSLTDYKDSEKKNSILKELFGKIGKNVAVDIKFFCDFGKNIYIGDDVIINSNCTFVDNETIHIGNRVLIAPNVQIYTAYHPLLPEERYIKEPAGACFFNTCAAPVIIKDGVWLGGGAIILPGVTVGENSVIGAGSIVSRSIPDNCVAVGNPCKPINFFDEIRKENYV